MRSQVRLEIVGRKTNLETGIGIIQEVCDYVADIMAGSVSGRVVYAVHNLLLVYVNAYHCANFLPITSAPIYPH